MTNAGKNEQGGGQELSKLLTLEARHVELAGIRGGGCVDTRRTSKSWRQLAMVMQAQGGGWEYDEAINDRLELIHC